MKLSRPLMFALLSATSTFVWWANPVLAQTTNCSVIGHRGLLLHAPENTLSNFEACLDLRLGFELDVRRCKTGQLVSIHDGTVDRTTNGKGHVADLTLDEINKLDAGSWFETVFRGERIPTIDAVFALVARHPEDKAPVAIDLKIDDPEVEVETVQLACKHRILDRLLFIGRAIDQADVRKRLRSADPSCHVAVLAQTEANLEASLADANADWIYVRFVPRREHVAAARASGKKIFISGPAVTGKNPETWAQALNAGVDAILTDYALECRAAIRLHSGPPRP